MARILVVDAERPIRAFIRRLLILEGHDVLDVGSSADALTAADGIFDLIVTDVEGFDDVDGYDLLDQIRARATHTPVIVVTARDDTEGALREAKAGVIDHVSKPILFGSLTSAVRRVLEADPKMLEDLRVTKTGVADLYRDAIELTRSARGRR